MPNSKPEPAAILIVDDNPTDLKLARVVLTLDSYTVREAEDAEAAEARIAAARPDLILLDLRLPGMDGFELAKRLKDDPRTRGIPILAVTAYAGDDEEAKAYAAGCDAFIRKPIDIEALSVAVVHLLVGP